jgi:cell division transport system permease protein
VRELKFKSAEAVWEEFRVEYLGEYADGFTENPLEDSANYEIYLSDVSMQSALITWLESLPEVSKINGSMLTADILSGANLLIAYVSVGIIVILLAVSIFLISNTVAIGISVRSEEINIMKYIGATDFFVRAPFVLEGMLIGAVGAALPLWLIYMLYYYVLAYIMERFTILAGFLNFVSVEELFRVLTPVSLAIGVGIGFLGSINTVRKHLQV